MKTLTILSIVLLLVQSYMAVDYVVTTKQFVDYNGKHGYISFPPTTYGQGNHLTFVFDFAYEGSNACILGMGKEEDYFDVIVSSNKLVIRDAEFEAQSSRTLKSKQYYNLIIQFSNRDGNSDLRVFLSGEDITSTFSRTKFRKYSNSQRKESYAGLCKIRNGKKHTDGVIYFDEFYIFDRQLTSSEIQNLADPTKRVPVNDRGLVVYYPFNEGSGHKAHGVTGTFSKESYTAKLANLARFTTRIVQGMLTCQSTGDPHVTDFYRHHWTPTHRKDWSRLVSCGTDPKKKFFTINAFHDFGHPSHPKATLNRELTVKYGKTVVKITLQLDILVKKKKDVYVNHGKNVERIEDLYFKYNNDKTVLYVYGSPFALLKVNKIGSTHLNVYITASSSLCTGKSYCQGNKEFIQEIEYEGDDDEVEVPPPLPDPPQAEPYDPCEEPDNQELKELAKTVCDGKWREGTPQHEACMFDICATGDPTVPDVDEECIAERRRLIEEGKEEEADLLPCKDNPCNCVFGTCNVETNECTCNPGFVGRDCSQESHLLNLTLHHSRVFNNLAIPLISRYYASVSVEGLVEKPAQINDYFVRNSFLVYIASVRDHGAEGNYKYSMYLVGDVSSKTNSHTSNIAFNVEGTVNKNTIQLLRGNGQVNGNSASITFGEYPNGLFIPDLGDDWCVEFDLSDSMFDQAVVGSGNKLNKLDVIKVPNDARGNVKICGKVLENNCAQYTNCKDCMAQNECGWCRSSGRCLFGNPAGPTEGSSCPKWAFTYDDETSRRINAEFGVPVNPKKQDIFLISGSKTLPVEVTVDMGHSRGSVFDVALVIPKDTSTLDYFRSHIEVLLDKYFNYPDIGIAFATYDSSQFKLEQPIGALDLSIPYISQVLHNLSPTNRNGDVNNALKLISKKQTNWRSTTRHVVIIVVGTNEANHVNAPRLELLGESIFPVFIVKGSKTHYQNYVDNIGFGAVIEIGSETQIKYALEEALELATRAVSLVPTQEGHLDEGDYDKSVWNIHGLDLDMRGRMQFPMTKRVAGDDNTILVAPGFGTATIENLLTDKPVPKSGDVEMFQEQPLTENNNIKGEIIELTGQSLDPNDPVQIEIIGFAPLPAGKPDIGIGKFYQLPDDISVFESEEDLAEYEIKFDPENDYKVIGEVFVSDATGKIVYVPPKGENAFSVSRHGRAPFTSIRYRVHDSCVASDEAKIDIFIAYRNDKPPVNYFTAHAGYENRPLAIELGGIDYRLHDLCAVIDKLPYQVVNGVEQPVGKFYNWNEGIFNQLSSVDDIYDNSAFDLEDLLEQLEETNVGEELCDNKVIFIPDRYTNSENIPASGKYQIDPQFSYHVIQQRNEHDEENDAMLESVPGTYSFFIHWVNQKPSVNLDGFDAPEGSCTYLNDCTFDQNLGVLLPGNPTPVLLSAIAGDIEEEPVDLVISSIQCHNALVEDSNGQEISNGHVIKNIEVYNWYSIIRFRPYYKEYGQDYCVISYYADDGNRQSDIATITIHINQVNQPPYSFDISINAHEEESRQFEVRVFDIDTNEVDVRLVGCDKSTEHKFFFTFNGVDFTTDDCDGLESSSLSLGTVTLANGVKVVQGTVFCDDDCPTEMGHVVTLYLNYDDNEDREDYVPYNYKISVEYLKLNRPGLLWLEGDEENKSTEYENNVDEIIPIQDEDNPCVPVGIRVEDDSGPTSVSLELFVIDKDKESNIVFFDIINPPSTGVDFSDTYARLSMSVSEMNILLPNIRVCSFDQGTFRIHFKYNDFGNSGVCKDGVLFCPYISNAYIGYKAADTRNIPGYIGGGAAAAIVVGAACAIGAWMKFKKLRAPEEGSDPWLLDDQNEGVVDNPMYEQRGVETENPLYEANLDE